MNGATTGTAVTGVVGYAVIDPTSILYCALAVVGILFFYFVFKSGAKRHMSRTWGVDQIVSKQNEKKLLKAQAEKLKKQAEAAAKAAE